MITLFILFLSLLYRIFGSFNNYPFWVDEFSTAKQARYILEYGLRIFTDPYISFEFRNSTVNLLVALFFKIGGQKEWIARLPLIFIGSLVPVAIYILANKIFNKTAALCASLFAVFSYFFITWSRQARSYVLFQLLILLAFFEYFRLMEIFSEKYHKRKNLHLALFFSVIFLGIITHPMFYMVIFSIVIHFILFKNSQIIKFFSSVPKLLLLLLFISLLLLQSWREGGFNLIRLNFFPFNNLWYYHSFLWREYSLITFLGVIGLFIGFSEKKKELSIILIYIIFHLTFILFMWGHNMTKYILQVFPFLFIGAGYTITKVTKLIVDNQINTKTIWSRRLYVLIPIFITLGIIANGDKFVTKPKKYYSLNKHFREIANIDYHKVYSIIKTKGEIKKGRTAVIDTWPDRVRWYLGNNFKNLYYFKWQNEPGIVSGHVKITEFFSNQDGEKFTKGKESVKYIGELSDLLKTMKKYTKGFIFIDDSSLQRDVIDYAEKNLKKELYLDHYPLDDNPYSIWPATLYSWGI